MRAAGELSATSDKVLLDFRSRPWRIPLISWRISGLYLLPMFTMCLRRLEGKSPDCVLFVNQVMFTLIFYFTNTLYPWLRLA